MEELLQYVWKHKIFPLGPLRTTGGQAVEVVHPGLHNHDAGPDFFNAKVKIDGQLWVGNVEIHLRSSDWFHHHHQSDPAYHNVILHVVSLPDMEIPAPQAPTPTQPQPQPQAPIPSQPQAPTLSQTPLQPQAPTLYQSPAQSSQPQASHVSPQAPVRMIPQLVLPIPKVVQERYDELVRNDRIPRCRAVVASQSALVIHNWMAALQAERLEQKTDQLMARHERCERSWEHTFFVTLARNFGFGINGDAFEAWARSIPLQAVAKHRDSLFQIEAFFFGQAGLLDDGRCKMGDGRCKMDDVRCKMGDGRCKMGDVRCKMDDVRCKMDDGGWEMGERDWDVDGLRREYAYLRQKFSLVPIDSGLFRFARLRPSNSPYVRIVQLAGLYYEQKLSFARVVGCESIEDFRGLLPSGLSVGTKDLLLINTFSPILFAYGRYKNEESFCERAIGLLEALKPERNWITRAWAEAGVVCESAADSQALIQLTHQYCEPRNCLRCRFGHEFIRQNPNFLQENKEEDCFNA